ncbi:hypothetical protein ABT010_05930 [Streptomyces sp. NPDC002668]|uniref:hypothetical protein n=1 Tax=Streptomyces sp. NPDC002668 TaxID=3154422 RepID=UPI00331DB831
MDTPSPSTGLSLLMNERLKRYRSSFAAVTTAVGIDAQAQTVDVLEVFLGDVVQDVAVDRKRAIFKAAAANSASLVVSWACGDPPTERRARMPPSGVCREYVKSPFGEPIRQQEHVAEA